MPKITVFPPAMPAGRNAAKPQATAPTLEMPLSRLRHRLMQAWHKPRSAQAVAVLLSAWLTLLAHWPLWMMFSHLNGYDGSQLLLVALFAPLVFACVLLLFSLTAWPRGMKPLWLALLVLAAVGQYFTLHYGTIIDKGMVLNVFQTDINESRDLLNPRLIAELLVIAGLPGLWLWRLPITSHGVWKDIARTMALMLAGLTLIVAVALPGYRQLAPVVRNNMSLRYMINPVNSVLAVLSAKVKPLLKRPHPFISITGGAALGASYSAAASTPPPLLVLVVGETSRGDHYSLNGYERETNPELARRDVLSWHNATSCGTSTRESLPCMFAHLGKAQFERRSAEYDNLLDVLQAAGLAVLWVDNQAGCKGVCERVASATTADSTNTAAGEKLCADGECLDEMLLEGLDERIATLPEAQRRNGVVVVLHQMGSHGPAYFRRSLPPFKVFRPECASTALASCSREEVINAYDNSIRYNDHVLAKTIDWLKQRENRYQVGMVYVSDHGESLGEGGIYLHGLPFRLAPDAQKSIAFIAWPGPLADRSSIDERCMRGTLGADVDHDNLYHTVLGLLDVHSPTYQSGLDLFEGCRGQERAHG